MSKKFILQAILNFLFTERRFIFRIFLHPWKFWLPRRRRKSTNEVVLVVVIIYSNTVLLLQQHEPSINVWNPKFETERGTYSNQASDGGARVIAFGLLLSHGFATRKAESHVLAVASVQVRWRTTAATRRLEHQIRWHPLQIHTMKISETDLVCSSKPPLCSLPPQQINYVPTIHSQSW